MENQNLKSWMLDNLDAFGPGKVHFFQDKMVKTLALDNLTSNKCVNRGKLWELPGWHNPAILSMRNP